MLIINHFIPLWALKQRELIPLLTKPFDTPGKRLEKLGLTLQRIMKNDDASRTAISLHIIEHRLCIKPLTVIARHQIIHHYSVTLPDLATLSPAHPSMRRTKKITLYILSRLINIIHKPLCLGLKSLQMMHSVITYPMPTRHHLPIEVRILPDIITHHKESGFNLPVIQQIEQARSHLRNRTIVESQINPLPPLLLNAKKGIRRQPAHPLRRSLYQHLSKSIDSASLKIPRIESISKSIESNSLRIPRIESLRILRLWSERSEDISINAC